MEELSIDTAKVNFVNHLQREVFVWTHYEECYKCSYMPTPMQLDANETDSKEFASYYTLKYKVTEVNSSIVDGLCSGTVEALDQSIYDLLIQNGTEHKCTLKQIQTGRNNLWPLLGAIGVLAIVAVAFYTARFFYKRSKDDKENDQLKSKISQRLNSLDAFRGMTILMMIFVNWGTGEYHFLEHIEWDGLRFADVIFPFFIFIMGVSMTISLRSLVIKKNVPLRQIYLQIVQRAIKLFILGLVVNSKDKPDVRTLRILGVLQRFSISYLVVSSVHVWSLHINRENLNSRISLLNDILPYWPEWILALIMLCVYFPVTFLWDFDPGKCPRGYLGVGGFSENATYPYCIGGAANKLDRLLFTENHIYEELLVGVKLYDPEVAPNKKMFGLRHDCEGVLGYTMSIVLTLIGLQVGKIMLTYTSVKQRVIRLVLWSAVLGILTGILAGTNAVPINKNLWSFTFVTVNGCLAILIFTIFYLLINHFKVWPNGHPFHYPGMNAILLYIGHEFTENVFPFFYISDYNSHIWPLTQNITGVMCWLLISVYLAKKNFFLTV